MIMHDEVKDKKNVVGTAKGPKIVDGEKTDSYCFQVYVEKKEDIQDLDADDVIPEQIDDLETDVIESGRLRLMGYNLYENEYPDRTDLFDPYVGGMEIQYEGFRGVGTNGSPPLKTENGDIVTLSNQHVAAPFGHEPEVGDSILHPSRGDVVGTLYDYHGPLDPDDDTSANDDALIEIDPDGWSDEILGLGKLEGLKTVEADSNSAQFVAKSGRTSGLTTGLIVGDDGEFRVNLGDDRTVEFTGIQSFTAMSMPGDSGSLICKEEDDGWYGIGLLFAGSAVLTLAIPTSQLIDTYGELEPVELGEPITNDPYDEGYDDGYEDGYDDGLVDGFEDGYDRGYADRRCGVMDILRLIVQR